jgi:hypothetical protein
MSVRDVVHASKKGIGGLMSEQQWAQMAVHCDMFSPFYTNACVHMYLHYTVFVLGCPIFQ